MRTRIIVSLLVVHVLLGGDAGANFTGQWHLNVQQSKWGKMKKPQNVDVTIEQNEPTFKYSGTVTSEGESVHTFEFSGAIDGKMYPVNDTYGPGMLSIKRVNRSTLSSVSKSSDGKHEVNATTYLSEDAKTLTRRITEKLPGGWVSWTEVYDKK